MAKAAACPTLPFWLHRLVGTDAADVIEKTGMCAFDLGQGWPADEEASRPFYVLALSLGAMGTKLVVARRELELERGMAAEQAGSDAARLSE